MISAGKLEERTRLRAPMGNSEESRMITPMQELPPPASVAPSMFILKKPAGGAVQWARTGGEAEGKECLASV